MINENVEFCHIFDASLIAGRRGSRIEREICTAAYYSAAGGNDCIISGKSGSPGNPEDDSECI